MKRKYQPDDMPFEARLRILFENQDIVRKMAKISDIFVTVGPKSYLMKRDALYELTDEQHSQLQKSNIISMPI